MEAGADIQGSGEAARGYRGTPLPSNPSQIGGDMFHYTPNPESMSSTEHVLPKIDFPEFTLSTYARKEKAKSQWINAKQFLSESDEMWDERLTSLADAMEDSGLPRPSGSDLGNKYIMSSDSSRHGDAKDRHEEQSNAIRTERISDEVWAQFTIPILVCEDVSRHLCD